MIKISVIVPVYNNQFFIKKCIDSILNQTLNEIEIILINDGSSDGTHEICEDIAQKNEKINYINKKNEGVSRTRNLGISLAKGEYIAFVDSDDYIDSKTFEKMYDKIKNKDLVIIGFNYVDENNNIKNVKLPPNLKNKEEYMEIKHDIFGYTWNKLYKKEIILENKIFFPTDTSMCEDFVFNYKYFNYIQKIESIQEALYFYYDNPNGLTKNYKKIFEVFKSFDEIINFDIKTKNKVTTILIKNYEKIAIGMCYSSLENLKHKDDGEYLKYKNELMKSLEKNKKINLITTEIYIFYREIRLLFAFFKTFIRKII